MASEERHVTRDWSRVSIPDTVSVAVVTNH